MTCSYNAGGGGGSGYIGGSKDGKHKLKSGKFVPTKTQSFVKKKEKKNRIRICRAGLQYR